MALHESDAFIKMITGPFGSGKSTAVCADILYYAMAQAWGPDMVRRTHVGVIRSTYPELKSTTRKSLLQVLPAKYGSIDLGAPMTGLYRFPLPDGYDRDGNYVPPTEVELQLTLIAAKTAEDTEKFKSANWSFVWINEAGEVDQEVIGKAAGRVGRYPDLDLGGCSYAGLLLDFNQPPPDHYLMNMKANLQPNWALFEQPPAAFKEEQADGSVVYIPNYGQRESEGIAIAENLLNLGKQDPNNPTIEKGLEYYTNQIDIWKAQGRMDLIESLFCMLDVPMKDGKPVHPEFSMETHVARGILEPLPYQHVVVGMDTSGIHPACIIMQENQGKWCITDELVGTDMSIRTFIEQGMSPLLATKYATCDVIVSADPANARDGGTGLSPKQHLEEFGYSVELAGSNIPEVRIQATSSMLNKIHGGLLISPHCHLIIRALQGAYRYKKLTVAGSLENVYDNKPDKRLEASHIADSLQYAILYITQGEFFNNPNNMALSQAAQNYRQAKRAARI